MAKIVNVTSIINSCNECTYFRIRSGLIRNRVQCALTETDLKKPYVVPDTCPLEDAWWSQNETILQSVKLLHYSASMETAIIVWWLWNRVLKITVNGKSYVTPVHLDNYGLLHGWVLNLCADNVDVDCIHYLWVWQTGSGELFPISPGCCDYLWTSPCSNWCNKHLVTDMPEKTYYFRPLPETVYRVVCSCADCGNAELWWPRANS